MIALTSRRPITHAIGALALFGSLGMTSTASAQIAPIAARYEAHSVHAGPFANPTKTTAKVYETVIDAGRDVPWLRIVFKGSSLPPGSLVQMTSMRDGGFQILEARHMREWRNGSAFFNGSRVLVELIAGPETEGNAFEVEKLLVGERRSVSQVPENAFAICPDDDDRLPSSNDAVARLLTGTLGEEDTYDGGCTGFIIDRPDVAPDKCHLSAGHCFVAGTKDHQVSSVVEFMDDTSQQSDANCDLNHPDPSLQFAVDMFEANNGGVGNDWAVFTCFPNPVTDLTTYETQGAALELADAVPRSGNVTVTGNGVDGNFDLAGGGNDACECDFGDGTGQWNQIQQTMTGPLHPVAGDGVDYKVDTCGANSGSPVILQSSGEVIAIHTHGGCEGGGVDDTNTGTEITLAELVKAIESCEATIPNECWLFLGQGSGQAAVTVDGVTFVTQMASVDQSHEVTMTEFPAFALPARTQGPRGLWHVDRPMVLSAQVVMYNPGLFPQNPSQWSQRMVVYVAPNEQPDVTWHGTLNGIHITYATYFGPDGKWYIHFPFTIDNL